jgi:hypothetical protein
LGRRGLSAGERAKDFAVTVMGPDGRFVSACNFFWPAVFST